MNDWIFESDGESDSLDLKDKLIACGYHVFHLVRSGPPTLSMPLLTLRGFHHIRVYCGLE